MTSKHTNTINTAKVHHHVQHTHNILKPILTTTLPTFIKLSTIVDSTALIDSLDDELLGYPCFKTKLTNHKIQPFTLLPNILPHQIPTFLTIQLPIQLLRLLNIISNLFLLILINCRTK